MQIVLEISEEEYQTYINHTEAILDSSIPLVHQDLLRAVINGAPLPKAENHGFIAVCDSMDAITQEVANKLKNTVFVGDEDCSYCFDIMEIIDADDTDTETWNGYHGQVTAPKGTFKRIYADADGGDAE